MGFSLGKTLSGAVSGFVASGGNPYGALAGGALGAIADDSAKSDYKWQQKQNIKLWDMQNEYNSPKAQMQRYIDAGLNPNLIYSQQNTAGDIAGATYNASDPIGTSTSLSSANNNSLMNKQQLNAIKVNNANTEARTSQIAQQMNNDAELLPYRKEYMDAQTQALKATYEAPSWLAQRIGKKNAIKVQQWLESKLGRLNSTTGRLDDGINGLLDRFESYAQ